MSTEHAPVLHLPAHVALGIHSDSLSAGDARARLEAIGRDDPQRAHGIVDELMACALRLVADGHPNPVPLAEHTLTVCSAEFPRWTA